MPVIIALEGGIHTGKSITIGILYELMKENNYAIIKDRKFEESRDFLAIFKKKKMKVGITSYGTNPTHIRSRFETFIQWGCDIIVFTCNPAGMTKTILENYSESAKVFVPKTIATFKSNRKNANLCDAKKILALIEKEVLVGGKALSGMQ